MDLAPLWIPAIRGFQPEEHRVVATISPESARDWIRLFDGGDGYSALNAVGDESFRLDLDFGKTNDFFLRASSDVLPTSMGM